MDPTGRGPKQDNQEKDSLSSLYGTIEILHLIGRATIICLKTDTYE